MKRPAYVYALAIVGVFAALGAGIGLAANFTLGFFIEQFVDPGQSPMDSIQVGMMLLVAIFLTYTLGPVAAGVAGVGVGQAMPDRELTAGVVAGAASFVGFFPYVGLSLFLTFSVLAEYTAPGSGGGGGGGGPLDPSGLLPLMVQVSLPVGLVGLATGYLSSRVSSAGRDGPAERATTAGDADGLDDRDTGGADADDADDGDGDGDDDGDGDGDLGVDEDVPMRHEGDYAGPVATGSNRPPSGN